MPYFILDYLAIDFMTFIFVAFEFGLQLDTDENFDITNKMRRQCPEGYRKRFLNPNERCSDQFTIGTGEYLLCLAWCYDAKDLYVHKYNIISYITSNVTKYYQKYVLLGQHILIASGVITILQRTRQMLTLK